LGRRPPLASTSSTIFYRPAHLPIRRRLVHGPSAAPLPAGIHARLAAAVEDRPYVVAVPEGAHRKLLEALDGRPALPAGIHARLANALLEGIR
jgi:hypothetical protein